jgi:predicted aspartyl protease
MIRYRYNEQVSPPAPFIRVAIVSPMTNERGIEVPAQLDTAADMSVVPLAVVESLGLMPMGEDPTLGFGGHLTTIPTYLVRVRIHDYPAREIEALVSPDEPYVLLGRDVLNGHKITFDGPNLALKIE